MKKIDIVSMAFGNFKRRKTRSILTVLGVVIGVSSIVIMMSLGVALDQSFNEQLEQMGDLTTISVNPGWNNETGEQSGKLDDEMVAKLEQIENVDAVVPLLTLSGKLASGKYVTDVQLIGIKPEHLEPMEIKLSEGELTRLFEPGGATRNIPMIFGSEIPYRFYNPKARNRGGMGMMMAGGMMIGGEEGEARPAPDVLPMAEETKMKFTFDWSYGEKKDPSSTGVVTKPVLYTVDVVGMIDSEQYSEKSYNVYLNMDTAKKLSKEQQKQQGGESGSGRGSKSKTQTYSSIKVISDSLEHTIEITKQIKEEYGLEAWSSAEFINQSKQMSGLIQMVLGGIGAVSLLVAAIGIANTMIMSIYERTREIGVMKVIGCQLRDIGTLFLCEAGFIGLFGGGVGLLLSYGASALLNFVGKNAQSMGMGMGGGQLSIIPIWLAVSAVAFAIFIGLLAGFLPARRAMKLSALEAMRT